MEITLLDACASDLSVVNAARVSFAVQHDNLEADDPKLINWLVKNRHGSPFEHGFFKFHVKAPIVVFREWHRHRVGHSYNEVSGRYVELEERFYFPAEARRQTGRPGNYEFAFEEATSELSEFMRGRMKYAYEAAWHSYTSMLEAGIAKEVARMVLPLGLYTEMIWSCNPRSLMHFCGLRNAPDAMHEIQQLAAGAEDALWEWMPYTAEAFLDNGRVSP